MSHEVHAPAPSSLRLTMIAAAIATLGVATSNVQAQTNVDSTKSASDELQTVVVTAQKRAEPLQKTAVAINTVDAAAIENKRIVAFDDLVRVSPSMTVTQNNNNSSVSLRGVGTQSFSIGVESTVSVLIDDVPVVQQLQAFSNLSDIERVEVLRGPQATLFGKNASAGVINVVTKESSDMLGGAVQVTATNDHERRVEASLSGPLSDKVGFRLNAYGSNFDGNIRNLSTGEDVNGERARGVRARLDARPTSDIKLRLIADHSTSRGVGMVTPWVSVPAGARYFGAVELQPSLTGLTPGFDNYAIRQSTSGYYDNKQSTFSVAGNWNIGNSTLTSVTSYQDWEYDFGIDQDGTDIDVLRAITRGAASGGLLSGGPYGSTMFTQELRLASNGSGPLNYLGGLYYADSSSDRTYTRGPTVLRANWSATATNKTKAAFGQMDYSFLDGTKVTGGLRFNRQTIGVQFIDRIPATPATYTGEKSEDAVTGKIALQQDLAKDVMVFGSFSTGFKGSGFDISTGFNQARARNPVAPEKSKSYELGVKSRFLNNRVQLNATAFLTDYDDFQAQAGVLDPNTGLLVVGLNNVGSLRTSGIELELTAKPSRAWLLDANLAYIDAEIRSFPTANCYPGQTTAQGCVASGGGMAQDLAGKTLSNAPKLKANMSVNYDFPLSAGGLLGSVNLNYQYQSKINFDLFQNPLTVQPGYGVVNGSISVRDPIRGFKVTFFANNLLDKHYASYIFDNAGAFGGAHVLSATLPRNSQRYVGVRLKYEF